MGNTSLKALALALAMAVAVSTHSQAATQSQSESSSAAPPAVATDQGDSGTTAAPVPGKNSFTKSQARKRLADHGYSHVRGLKLDSNGIWRAKAVKDGNSIQVSLDYQGNIVSQ